MLEFLGRPFQSWPGRIAAAAVVVIGVVIGVMAGSGGDGDQVVVEVEATPTEARPVRSASMVPARSAVSSRRGCSVAWIAGPSR